MKLLDFNEVLSARDEWEEVMFPVIKNHLKDMDVDMMGEEVRNGLFLKMGKDDHALWVGEYRWRYYEKCLKGYVAHLEKVFSPEPVEIDENDEYDVWKFVEDNYYQHDEMLFLGLWLYLWSEKEDGHVEKIGEDYCWVNRWDMLCRKVRDVECRIGKEDKDRLLGEVLEMMKAGEWMPGWVYDEICRVYDKVMESPEI